MIGWRQFILDHQVVILEHFLAVRLFNVLREQLDHSVKGGDTGLEVFGAEHLLEEVFGLDRVPRLAARIDDGPKGHRVPWQVGLLHIFKHF
jgi:hypothetical protein